MRRGPRPARLALLVLGVLAAAARAMGARTAEEAPLRRRAVVVAKQAKPGVVAAPPVAMRTFERFRFCKTAKAGTSAIRALLWEAPFQGKPTNLARWSQKHNIEQHGGCRSFETWGVLKRNIDFTTFVAYQAKQNLADDVKDKLPSFTTVRNPFDRVISAYRDKYLPTKEGCPPVWGRSYYKEHGTPLPFADFVRDEVSSSTNHHLATYGGRCRAGYGKNGDEESAFPYTRVIPVEDGLMGQLADFFELAGEPGLARAARRSEAGADIQGSHRSSCVQDGECDSDLRRAKQEEHYLALRRRYFLESPGIDPAHPRELVAIVARRYRADLEAFNYTFGAYGPVRARRGGR